MFNEIPSPALLLSLGLIGINIIVSIKLALLRFEHDHLNSEEHEDTDYEDKLVADIIRLNDVLFLLNGLVVVQFILLLMLRFI